MGDAYIVGAVRTAAGRRNGMLKGSHPIDLGAAVLNELILRTGADPGLIEDVIFGCVDQVGAQAANVARNVVLAAGLPETVPAMTVDRQCGSSQQAVHFAAQAVMAGVHDVVVAGGVEVMSMVPLGGNAIAGHKAGYGVPYGAGMKRRYPGVKFSQFAGAEMMAQKWGLSRETARRVRSRQPSEGGRRHRERTLRARDRAGRGDPRRRLEDGLRPRRGHPLRRQPRVDGGAEGAQRGGVADRRHVEPDLRRRGGRSRRQRSRAAAASARSRAPASLP